MSRPDLASPRKKKHVVARPAGGEGPGLAGPGQGTKGPQRAKKCKFCIFTPFQHLERKKRKMHFCAQKLTFHVLGLQNDQNTVTFTSLSAWCRQRSVFYCNLFISAKSTPLRSKTQKVHFLLQTAPWAPRASLCTRQSRRSLKNPKVFFRTLTEMQML